MLGRLPLEDFTLVEPESDLLLGILDAVGAMADVAADIDGIFTPDRAWCRYQWVGGTEESYTLSISLFTR